MTTMTRSAYKFWHGEELPREIAYLCSDHPEMGWQEITFKEVLDEKREKQKAHLECLMQSDIETIKPCFIWTFRNKGFPFGGWWLYVKTLKEDYALNFRNHRLGKLQTKAMRLFPCGMLPLIENIDGWMEEFAKIHPYPTKKRKKQGMALAWAKIKGNKLIDIVNSNGKEVTHEKSIIA